MKHTPFVLSVILVLCVAAVPAEASDPGWTVRVFAAGFDPDLDVVVPAENPDEVRVTADSDLGFGASLEYQFTTLFGLELGFLTASPAIVLSAENIPGFGDISLSDSLSTTATTLDLNFHLTPASEYFDFYLGAGLTYLSYGDLSYAEPDGDTLNLATGNDLGYSVKAGLGISQQLGGHRRPPLYLGGSRGHPRRNRDLRLRHVFFLSRHRVQLLNGPNSADHTRHGWGSTGMRC